MMMTVELGSVARLRLIVRILGPGPAGETAHRGVSSKGILTYKGIINLHKLYSLLIFSS